MNTARLPTVTKNPPPSFREGLGEGFESLGGSAPPLAPPRKVAITVYSMAESTVATLRGGGFIGKICARFANY